MNERDWELLKVLYEIKSITRAADRLFMTQPALSIRLRNMESYFNTTLVIRNKRGIQFTAEGEYLAKKASFMLNEMTNVKEHILTMKGTISGTVRIGASHFMSKFILPPILQSFKKEYPEVRYQVFSGWSRDILQLVVSNNVHMGFVRGEYHFSGERLLLYKDVMCFANKDKVSASELDKLYLIDYQNDPLNQLLINRWWVENYSIPPRISMNVDRLDTCLEMVRNGLGYGFLPSTVMGMAPEIYHEPLTYKNGKYCERDTWLFYNKDACELSLVKAFIDKLSGMEIGACKLKAA
ncbi:MULTISPECIES: LysR family transcriptional regulator [unclassified Bartonella]|uniref:LysR family transcriptional regulator n=1 Tax=unclassified Bartonella TaxID=2645622 RepID=UPI0015FAC0FB|nr:MULTISPECIES: LysR family transcriptional regulator [unclassified Bartonella]UXN03798.1 LysR family transcriptional regulator [Bartonella sp. HY406]UXN06768.1 LysR family transcriptional regulator [Bartonella sp. HY761]